MNAVLFEHIYRSMPLPVIVCRGSGDHALVFANPEALLLLNPRLLTAVLADGQSEQSLGSFLRCSPPDTLDALLELLRQNGAAHNYLCEILDSEDRALPARITANCCLLDGETFYALYITLLDRKADTPGKSIGGLMDAVHRAAYRVPDPGEAIDRILALSGEAVDVSRAYIFEEISPDMTRNTYEWCAPGVLPAIQDLQALSKDTYSYDAIVGGGVYVADDIRDLPPQDFSILHGQGIKSLAIIPLYHAQKPLGYIGFDDCMRRRKWTGQEIDTLVSVAEVISSLISRRSIEEQALRSLEILQTISDNMDNIIYVNTLDTYELVFINKALADSLGQSPEELLGNPCWQVLQRGKTGPCEFCPIPNMLDPEGNITQYSYTWEFQNTITHKWYLVRDSIIRWVGGQNVHIETATEITPQKQYEQKLEYYASTDMMTGVHNREWGYKMMEDMLSAPAFSQGTVSLVFLDLDGLKNTNDTFGHDAGDDMILTVVRTVRDAIRKSDAMFRWGGDEFILLLQCGIEPAQRIVSNIQAKLEIINQTEQRPYRLSFSYGIAAFGSPEYPTIDSIVTEADHKMYENKMAKRGKCR